MPDSAFTAATAELGVSEPAPQTRSHSPLFLWSAALGGAAVGWLWLRFSQPLVDTIQVSSVAALASLYYGLVYVPLALLAVVLGSLCVVKPWRIGSAPGRWAAVGLTLGFAGIGLATGMAWLNGGLASGAHPPGPARLMLLGAALMLLQVAAEELLFRGWLLATIGRLHRPSIAIGVTAIAYAVVAMAGSGFALLPFVNLALSGVFLALLAARSGGLVAPIAAHFGWAATESLVAGLNPNPGVGPFGALRNLDLFGLPIWGGSEAGLAEVQLVSAQSVNKAGQKS